MGVRGLNLVSGGGAWGLRPSRLVWASGACGAACEGVQMARVRGTATGFCRVRPEVAAYSRSSDSLSIKVLVDTTSL